jgi:acetylglutamate kinase
LAGDRVQSPDLGFVGEVTSVDWQLLDRAAATGEIPIIPSLIHGSGGSWLNVNADDAATAIASQWPAGHLVFLTDTAGILRDVSDPNSRIATIRPSEIEALISDGVVTGGMIPKARGCVAALNSAGLESVQIIDGGVPHSLLMKLLTGHCPGTEFIP